ncbi:hypothetical protein CIP107552_01731 [Corynebacterium diphtheriae]|nr:hypothetical protein CIP107552_01731 [Corynebacterium diphtheriae]CAB0757221.1 hypothetical protein FRC0137_01730 [Corynebacterium diphtheriae]CAB0870078.1 hypothetical protein FRC0375_01757 [Corynebacterium diphtheriae]
MGTLLIDVDGTVVDSYPGIREAFIHSMTSVGIPVPEESWLRRIPGPPMVETMRALGQSDSVTAAALACFRSNTIRFLGVTLSFSTAGMTLLVNGALKVFGCLPQRVKTSTWHGLPLNT